MNSTIAYGIYYFAYIIQSDGVKSILAIKYSDANTVRIIGYYTYHGVFLF